jgi:hypothetical protein
MILEDPCWVGGPDVGEFWIGTAHKNGGRVWKCTEELLRILTWVILGVLGSPDKNSSEKMVNKCQNGEKDAWGSSGFDLRAMGIISYELHSNIVKKSQSSERKRIFEDPHFIGLVGLGVIR